MSSGGGSTTLYPGPPVPVPDGSPPWITKPGTIRWKNVPSKKSFSASATNDATAFGEAFGSSVIVNVPQLVSTTTLYVFVSLRSAVGAFSCPLARGAGRPTLSQPSADGAAVSARVAASVVGGAAASSSSSP